MPFGRRSKFNAKKIELDGIPFDSKAEVKRYVELLEMDRTGVISALEVHPSYMLQEAFRSNRGEWCRAITYEGDFQYQRDGMTYVEDVKAMRTEAFKIKRKLFIRRYPNIQFIEVNVKQKKVMKRAKPTT